ncbi:hypothetical protein OPU71_09865 [Niveibacterium sp. 24ML]|uniref:hypothetical protein n=1 Tax=Niveibacterium sp. 24ML TaxID=2985512 RepID=UPI002271E661|nr:hypothetical protein [Niveibacterium sp. 24ML]MCX9156428.1 hypothetical protein [Niveibacterium sp. 24ML]
MKTQILTLLMALASASPALAETLRVGPNEAIRTIADAARLAKDGDVVEITAGEYRGDVAVWSQKDLTIRGVGGMPRLLAMGASAEGKGIFVVRGERVRIENLEFRGAKVRDKNGAGIRLETGKLTVVGCKFLENENGILTSNNEQIELQVERSEFGHNGAGDGQSHNLYAGKIASLKVSGSYFHHAKVGHLLKSRARDNRILYNRLTDEIAGKASYELEFPSGGIAVVIGNLIEQSSSSENFKIISMGAEGLAWPTNALYLSHNTIVNDRPQGARMLDARDGVSLLAVNNVLVGRAASIDLPAQKSLGNVEGDWPDFVRPQRDDYRLRNDSKLLGAAEKAGFAGSFDLTPTAEYVHPVQIRAVAPKRWSPGAFQTPGG